MTHERPRNQRRKDYPYYYSSYPNYPVPLIQAPVPVSSPGNLAPLVSVTTLTAKNAAVANVTVSKPPLTWDQAPAWEFKSDGSSKREQGDRSDPETGEMLALGRALVEAGEQMVREAAKRVQDSIARQDEERRRADERKENKAKPVKHRTLQEWELIQRLTSDGHATSPESTGGRGLIGWTPPDGHATSPENMGKTWGGKPLPDDHATSEFPGYLGRHSKS